MVAMAVFPSDDSATLPHRGTELRAC